MNQQIVVQLSEQGGGQICAQFEICSLNFPELNTEFSRHGMLNDEMALESLFYSTSYLDSP